MLTELQRQREVIQRAQGALHDANGEVRIADGVLKRMGRWFNR